MQLHAAVRSSAAIALIIGAARSLVAQSPPAPPPPTTPAQPEPAKLTGVAKIREDASRLRPLVQSQLAQRFLDAAAYLPEIKARRVYQDPGTKKWYTPAQAGVLDAAARAALTEKTFDEQYYYNTRYGTPLAYARALEVAAWRDEPRLPPVEEMNILDYGYGGIGHLRLLASLGARVVGLEVDPLLPALYTEPGDTGRIAGVYVGGRQAPDGTLKIFHGRFPADAEAIAGVSEDRLYQLVISKNTLKNGYINPEHPVEKRLLVDLGVQPEQFVKSIYNNVAPEGLFLIYNLCPAPSKPGEPYKHWADGRCPFPREMLEKAGFRLLEFDKDDSAAAREMARALGWDKEGMDVENDLFALYTLVQRPAE
jgi:hypothetical protein